VADTLIKPLEMSIDNFHRRYQNGLELIRDLENGELTVPYATHIRKMIRESKFEATTGMPSLDDFRKEMGVPVGYASWPGLQTLAMDKYATKSELKGLHVRAKDFCNVVSSMYYRMARSMFNCIFMDAAQQSPYFKIPDGRTAFFENLISVPRPNIYVTLAVAGDAPAIDGELKCYKGVVMTVNDKTKARAAAIEAIALTFGAVEALTSKVDRAVEMMVVLLGVRDKLPVQAVTKLFVGMFNLLVGDKRDEEIQTATKFAKEFMTLTTQTQIGTFSQRLLNNHNTNLITLKNGWEKAMGDAKTEVEEFVDGAQERQVPTQLVASKRMLLQLGDSTGTGTDLFAIMKPSPFLNGMVPPGSFDAAGGPVSTDNQAQIKTDAMMLFRARSGDGSDAYTLDYTTPETRDVMPVGSKRGRDEYGEPPAARARFGARFGLNSEDDQEFERGGRGMSRNPGVVGQGVLKLFNHNFKWRFNDLNQNGDELRRLASQALLGTPIHKTAFSRMIDNDVFFPIGFLVARPFITHLMGTAILTTAGREVGETLVGHADFQLTDNVVQKMHYGNFTMYARSLIYHPDKVYIATDIICKRYVMGNDMTFFDRSSFGRFKGGNNGPDARRSILVMTVPADARVGGLEYPNPLDLSGNMQSTLQELSHDHAKQYASADWYREQYGISNENADQYGDFFEYFPRSQTLCFQGMQWNWSPGTNSHSSPVQNTGHWGYRVYEGCAQVRSGAMKLLRECNYSMYGGPANTSLGY
jgi:hypothetical protein